MQQKRAPKQQTVRRKVVGPLVARSEQLIYRRWLYLCPIPTIGFVDCSRSLSLTSRPDVLHAAYHSVFWASRCIWH